MARKSKARTALLVFLATRSLLDSRLTLVLLVLAVAAGAGFQIPNTANLAGYNASLLEEGLRWGAGDVRVQPLKERWFEDGNTKASEIQALLGARATVPILVFPGAVGKAGRFQEATIHGLDLTGTIYPIHLHSGALPKPGDEKGLLLGSALAKRLGVQVNDTVDLRAIFGSSGPDSEINDENVGRYKMTVRGLVTGGFGAYRAAFVDKTFLASEAGEPNAASVILVHLDNHFSASLIAHRINEKLPDVQAIAWTEDDPYLPNSIRANGIVGTVSHAMVIAAVSIPVWALLYIHVLNRRKEIGILAGLGFRRREIFLMFLIQAVVVGVIGVLIGSGLGYLIVRYFQAHPIFEWQGFVIRPLLSWTTFSKPVLIVLAITVLAGAYPAWRATRVDPARVLRRIE